MAKLNAPLGSFSASGSLAKTLNFRRSGGLNLVSKYSKPGDFRSFSASDSQSQHRAFFSLAIEQWRSLTSEQKAQYAERAILKGWTGYNLFLSEFLSDFLPPVSDFAGWWKLDEGTGSLAFDSSLNGNTGSLINSPSWVPGLFGSALSFNGLSQYVSIPSVASVELTAGFSVCFSLKASALSGANLGKYIQSPSFAGWLFGARSVGFYFTVRLNGENWLERLARMTVLAGQWYRVVFTYKGDGTVPEAWVNGFKIALGPSDTQSNGDALHGIADSGTPLLLGSSNGFTSPPALFFPGLLDDVRLYNVVLSDLQAVVLSTLP